MAKLKKKSRPWKWIPVNKGHRAKVDAEDYERVMEHTWRVRQKPSGRIKAVTNIKTPRGYRQVSLGHFIMKPPKGKMVYPRRFNDGLDYRKDNLIICTMAERQRMLPKSKNIGSSMYRGVSYIKGKNKWMAGIKVKGRSINLGTFKSEAAAALAYNKAAKKYFGDSAYQNQIKYRPKRSSD